MLKQIYANFVEQFFDRPVLARDRILRAFSMDGLHWQRDRSFVYSPYYFSKHSMHYFACKDARGNTWFRSSVLNGLEWYPELKSEQAKVNFGTKLSMLLSPCWLGDDLIAIVKCEVDGQYFPAYLRMDGCRVDEVKRIEFDRASELFSRFEDVLLVSNGEENLVFASGTTFSNSCEIHIWQYQGCHEVALYKGPAIEPRRFDQVHPISNNPTIIRLPTGEWRMYYRNGRLPAVGNVILSAVSKDLIEWTAEPGVRLSPEDSKWEKSGLGFPYVTYDERSGLYLMYYTGFWGDCADALRCEAEWRLRFGDV